MKAYIILFIGLLSLCLSEASLVGAKECTLGPTYWCGSLRNAKECGAVKHCIQTVWEKQKFPEDNDDVCKICKEMVKEARDQLLSNETQDEIRQVFEGSCKLIPVTIVQKECIKLADNFIPELIETLASQMNPDAVCSTAGLCNNIWVDKMLRKFQKKVVHQSAINAKKVTPTSVSVANENCKDCKTFLQDLVQIVNTHSRAEILDHMLNICGRLGSLSDGCMSLVQINFEVIYGFLSGGFNPQDICDLLGMCPRLYGDKLVVITKTGDEPCDFCVAIVEGWRNNLVANTTKEEFKMILDGICQHTGDFEKECLSLVDQYFEELYEILVSNIRPKEMCEAVGLCGAKSVFKNELPVWTIFGMNPEDHLALVPLQPSIDMRGLVGRDEAASYKPHIRLQGELIGRDEAASYRPNIRLPKVPLTRPDISVVSIGEKGVVANGKGIGKIGDANQCIMCEFVLHFLQNVLNDNTTREEVKQAVDKVCNLFPHKIAEQCQDYVDAYGDQLIQLLILDIDPAQICPMLHLCPGKTLSGTSRVGDSTCVMCEFVMTKLDDILKDKSDEEAIKAAVDSVCIYFPQSIRSQCKSFVDMYVDQIIDLLVNDISPAQICEQLGLCQSSGVATSYVPKVMSPHNYKDSSKKTADCDECTVCKFVLHFLQDVLNNNRTEEGIREGLGRVCSMFPTKMAQLCQDYVDAYDEMIVQNIILNMDPSKICPYLHICEDKTSLKTSSIAGDSTCILCEFVMTKLDDIVKDKSNEAAVKLALENVCSYLPMSIRTQCTNFVDTYTELIIQLLVENLSPDQICTRLGLCSSKAPLLEPIDPMIAQLPISRLFIPKFIREPQEVKSVEVTGKQSLQCVMCEFIMEKVDSLIISNSTVKEIEFIMEKVCMLLPKTLINDCLGFLDQYIESVVELLLHYIQPDFVCREMKICKATFHEALFKTPVSFPFDKCQVCEEVMQWVDQKEKEGQVINIIDSLIDEVCNYLPAKAKSTCYKLVNEYGTVLEKLLEELSDPKHVCQALKMCPNHGTKQLLGAKKCTWGPSYWCQSRIHAEACQATEHCTEKAWGGVVPSV